MDKHSAATYPNGPNSLLTLRKCTLTLNPQRFLPGRKGPCSKPLASGPPPLGAEKLQLCFQKCRPKVRRGCRKWPINKSRLDIFQGSCPYAPLEILGLGDYPAAISVCRDCVFGSCAWARRPDCKDLTNLVSTLRRFLWSCSVHRSASRFADGCPFGFRGACFACLGPCLVTGASTSTRLKSVQRQAHESSRCCGPRLALHKPKPWQHGSGNARICSRNP